MSDGLPSMQVVQPVDLARIQTAYPLLGLDPLTSQEEQFVIYKARGLSTLVAGRSAGYTPEQAEELLLNPDIALMVEYLLARNNRQVEITRDMLNVMLLEAHRKSATATEEIMAARELGKLNDLYPDPKRASVEININKKAELTERHIKDMPEERLLELVGDTIDLDLSEYEVERDGPSED